MPSRLLPTHIDFRYTSSEVRRACRKELLILIVSCFNDNHHHKLLHDDLYSKSIQGAVYYNLKYCFFCHYRQCNLSWTKVICIHSTVRAGGGSCIWWILIFPMHAIKIIPVQYKSLLVDRCIRQTACNAMQCKVNGLCYAKGNWKDELFRSIRPSVGSSARNESDCLAVAEGCTCVWRGVFKKPIFHYNDIRISNANGLYNHPGSVA